MPEVTVEFLKNVVDHVEATGLLHEKVAQEQQAIAAQSTIALGALKKAGLCAEGATDEQLMTKLADHSECLRVISRLADRVQVAPLGAPAEKTASEAGSEGMKESDRVFLSRLGLA